MPPEKVAAIREQNNSTTADRLITDATVDSPPVPNPVETFEQCFSEYPDLLGVQNILLVCLISFHNVLLIIFVITKLA